MRFADVSQFIAAVCLAAMVLSGVLLGFVFWMLGGGWLGYLLAPAILVAGIWWIKSDRPRENQGTKIDEG